MEIVSFATALTGELMERSGHQHNSHQPEQARRSIPTRERAGRKPMRSLIAAVSANRSEGFFRGDGTRRVTGQPTLPSAGRAKLRRPSKDELEAAMAGAGCLLAQDRKLQIRDALADRDVFGALGDDDLDGLIKPTRLDLLDQRSGGD
jgi:hypothetical protein